MWLLTPPVDHGTITNISRDPTPMWLLTPSPVDRGTTISLHTPPEKLTAVNASRMPSSHQLLTPPPIINSLTTTSPCTRPSTGQPPSINISPHIEAPVTALATQLLSKPMAHPKP